MEPTKPRQQPQNQPTENIYQNFRTDFLNLSSIGKVMGHEELQKAFKKLQQAPVLLELQK
jgi:hypothetical protein